MSFNNGGKKINKDFHRIRNSNAKTFISNNTNNDQSSNMNFLNDIIRDNIYFEKLNIKDNSLNKIDSFFNEKDNFKHKNLIRRKSSKDYLNNHTTNKLEIDLFDSKNINLNKDCEKYLINRVDDKLININKKQKSSDIEKHISTVFTKKSKTNSLINKSCEDKKFISETQINKKNKIANKLNTDKIFLSSKELNRDTIKKRTHYIKELEDGKLISRYVEFHTNEPLTNYNKISINNRLSNINEKGKTNYNSHDINFKEKIIENLENKHIYNRSLDSNFPCNKRQKNDIFLKDVLNASYSKISNCHNNQHSKKYNDNITNKNMIEIIKNDDCIIDKKSNLNFVNPNKYVSKINNNSSCNNIHKTVKNINLKNNIYFEDYNDRVDNSNKLLLKDLNQKDCDCDICDNFLLQINQVKINCDHKLCQKCIKAIIEERIENKDYILKCPIYFCVGIIKLRDIQKIIGDKHYTVLFNLIFNEYINHNMVQIKKNESENINDIDFNQVDSFDKINNISKILNSGKNINKKYERNYLKIKIDEEKKKNTNNKESIIGNSQNEGSIRFLNKKIDYLCPRNILSECSENNYNNENLFSNERRIFVKNSSPITIKDSGNSSLNNISELNFEEENFLSSKNNSANFREKSNKNIFICRSKNVSLSNNDEKILNLNISVRSEVNKRKHLILKKEILIVNNIKLDQIDIFALKRYNSAPKSRSNLEFIENENSLTEKLSINLFNIKKDLDLNNVMTNTLNIRKKLHERCSVKQMVQYINMPKKIKTHLDKTRKFFIRSNFKRDFSKKNKHKKISFLLKDVKTINEKKLITKLKNFKNNLNFKFSKKKTLNKMWNITLAKPSKPEVKFYEKDLNELSHSKTNLSYKNIYQIKGNDELNYTLEKENAESFKNNRNLIQSDKIYNIDHARDNINGECFLNINNNLKNQFYNQNINNYNNKSIHKSTMADTLKNFAKKNVSELADNETFLLLNQYKESYCTLCNEPALYFKLNTNYLKCLNCFSKLCRFCFKIYTENHFDLSKLGRCKIYFKKNNVCGSIRKSFKISDINKFEKFKRFMIMFIINLSSYLFLIVFIMNKINGLFEFKKEDKKIIRKIKISSVLITNKKSNSFYNFIILIMKLINSLLFLMFSFLLLPFFPLLINCFEYILN